MWARAALRSQWTNVRLFRAFFPPVRSAIVAARFLKDYASGDTSLAYPFSINIELTRRCGLGCSYCYHRPLRDGGAADLPHDTVLRLVAEGRPYRPGYMLTGGEPALRPDLVEIVRAMKAARSAVGVVTSGTSLTVPRTEALVAAGLDAAVVSLHGPEAAHDRIVARAGAYRHALDVLEVMARRMRRGGPLVNLVVNAESAEGLPQVLADVAARGRIPVRLAHRLFVTPAEAETQRAVWARDGDGGPVTIGAVEDPATGPEMGRIVRALAGGPGRHMDAKPALAEGELARWYAPGYRPGGRRCVFIWNSTFVGAGAEVFPCQTLLRPMGHVVEQPLAAIWNGPRYRRLRRLLKRGLLPACARCCKL